MISLSLFLAQPKPAVRITVGARSQLLTVFVNLIVEVNTGERNQLGYDNPPPPLMMAVPFSKAISHQEDLQFLDFTSFLVNQTESHKDWLNSIMDNELPAYT